MRDLFLAPLLLAILFQTFRTPSAGVLGWTWLTLMTPQKLIWGLLSSMPLNMILALATLVMVVFTRDKKKLPIGMTSILWILLVVMMTVTTIFALSPSHSWGIWNRVVKVMLLGSLVPVLMSTQRRLHALIWVIVMCLGYFGVKGGIFTLMTGSGGHVVGPPDSQLIPKIARKSRTTKIDSRGFNGDPIIPEDVVQIVSDLAGTDRPANNKLSVELIGDTEFRGGQTKSVVVLVCRGSEHKVVPDAEIMIKVMGSSFKPLIFHSRSNPFGISSVDVDLPEFKEGRAAVVAGEFELERRRALRLEVLM